MIYNGLDASCLPNHFALTLKYERYREPSLDFHYYAYL